MLAWVASLWSNLENLLNYSDTFKVPAKILTMHSDTFWENNTIISPKTPPYTFNCHPICLLCNFKKSLAILLFGSSPSYTFIKFWEKFQPILLFRPVRLFGTLEYTSFMIFYILQKYSFLKQLTYFWSLWIVFYQTFRDWSLDVSDENQGWPWTRLNP